MSVLKRSYWWVGLAAISLTTGVQSFYPLGSSAAPFPHPDRLSTTPWWIHKVKAQAVAWGGQQFQGCLFGDSISSSLGRILGPQIVNFSQGGLSSTSLLTQLKLVKAAQIQCTQAVIEIGTNDAWYSIRNRAFTQNMRHVIALTRSLGADDIAIVPAFYSTVAASRNPKVAGPLWRVDQINRLMRQIAKAEDVDYVATGLESLFQKHHLKSQVTFDGVHLNQTGKTIYRKFLTQIFRLSPKDNTTVNLEGHPSL